MTDVCQKNDTIMPGIIQWLPGYSISPDGIYRCMSKERHNTTIATQKNKNGCQKNNTIMPVMDIVFLPQNSTRMQI